MRSLQTQTNALDVIPLLLQTVKPQRQEMPHLGGNGIALHQNAPLAFVYLPIYQVRPQGRRHHFGDALRALL